MFHLSAVLYNQLCTVSRVKHHNLIESCLRCVLHSSSLAATHLSDAAVKTKFNFSV